MGWFTRTKEGITTSTEEKKETPEGLWYKCPECSEIMTSEDHENNLWVCNKCQYHEKIVASEILDKDPLQLDEKHAIALS